MEWQPIHSAPKNGSLFIGFQQYGVSTSSDGTTSPLIWVRECRWQDGCYRAEDIRIGRPTHWIPLPSSKENKSIYESFCQLHDAAKDFLISQDEYDNEETSTFYPDYESRLKRKKASRDALISVLDSSSP